MGYKENAELVENYLRENGWHYVRRDREDRRTAVFLGGVSGLGGIHDTYRFALCVDDDAVQYYAILPVSAQDKKVECAEFISRANCGMKFGKFELDFRDGEVRFHIIYPIDAIRIKVNESMQRIIRIASGTVREYVNGLMLVLIGQKTPAEAITEIERRT